MKRFALVMLLLVMLFPAAVEAQEMSVRFYLMPVLRVENYRGPMYLFWRMNPTGLNVPWSCKDYGKIDIMICAVNGEQADHGWLVAQADVVQLPANMDANLTAGQVNVVRDWLENHQIPGDWVSPSDTWRGVARTVTQLFLYMQRVTHILGYAPSLTPANLNRQLNELPADVLASMQQAATELGYDLTPVRMNWTVRRYLKYMSDQWGTRPIYFGFITL